MRSRLALAMLFAVPGRAEAASNTQTIENLRDIIWHRNGQNLATAEQNKQWIRGWALVTKGDRILLEEHAGSVYSPADRDRERENVVAFGTDFDAFTDQTIWRWASVTKQIVATIVMQEVAAGRIDLDAPIRRYLRAFAGATGDRITVRQLLRHQSGLPNPDDTLKTRSGMPGYYMRGWTGNRNPATGYCAGAPLAEPGGSWRYNNCDYIVAGALLESVTGKPWTQLVSERIAKPLKLRTLKFRGDRAMTVPAYVDGNREPEIDFAAYGAAGGLFGSAQDLWKFDRALMSGKLLPATQLKEMWDGRPELGSIALGQWVFSAPLKGCAAPVRIVERRGAIGGVQVRNFILPEKDVVVIAFTNRGEFDFGEVWQSKGFSYDLLSAAACS